MSLRKGSLPTASLYGNCQPRPANSYDDCLTYLYRKGILVDDLLVAMVSVSPMILDVLWVCPHMYVHRLVCALTISKCLLLVWAKTCWSGDECELHDENDTSLLSLGAGGGMKSGSLRLLTRSAEKFLQIDWRERRCGWISPEKSTSAGTKTPFTFWTQQRNGSQWRDPVCSISKGSQSPLN